MDWHNNTTGSNQFGQSPRNFTRQGLASAQSWASPHDQPSSGHREPATSYRQDYVRHGGANDFVRQESIGDFEEVHGRSNDLHAIPSRRHMSNRGGDWQSSNTHGLADASASPWYQGGSRTSHESSFRAPRMGFSNNMRDRPSERAFQSHRGVGSTSRPRPVSQLTPTPNTTAENSLVEVLCGKITSPIPDPELQSTLWSSSHQHEQELHNTPWSIAQHEGLSSGADPAHKVRRAVAIDVTHWIGTPRHMYTHLQQATQIPDSSNEVTSPPEAPIHRQQGLEPSTLARTLSATTSNTQGSDGGRPKQRRPKRCYDEPERREVAYKREHKLVCEVHRQRKQKCNCNMMAGLVPPLLPTDTPPRVTKTRKKRNSLLESTCTSPTTVSSPPPTLPPTPTKASRNTRAYRQTKSRPTTSRPTFVPDHQATDLDAIGGEFGNEDSRYTTNPYDAALETNLREMCNQFDADISNHLAQGLPQQNPYNGDIDFDFAWDMRKHFQRD